MNSNSITHRQAPPQQDAVPAADRLRPASSPQTIDGVWLIIASRILLSISLATSCLVMLSWLAGWSEFQSLISGLPTMKFNSALAFTLLASGGLLGKSLTTRSRLAKRTADLLVGTALAIGVANLLQSAAGIDLGIDTLFCADPASLHAGKLPGRSSSGTSLGITLLALGVMLDKLGTKRFSQIALILGGLIGAIAILHFIRSASGQQDNEFYATTAIHSAILLCFMMLSFLIQQRGWRLALQSAERHDLKAEFRRSRGMAVLVSVTLAIGLAVTAGFVIDSQQTLKKDARERFHMLSDNVATNVRKQLNQCIYGLKGARGMYAANQAVERNMFKAYVDSRDLQREFPGVRGFGCIQRVLRQDLAAFVAAERADHAPDFTVQTTGNAPDLFVIKNIYPLESNRAAWGYDIGSESIRRAAAERAMRTGEPTLSGSVTLLQDEQRRRGFLYFLPVYKKGTAPQTPAEREAALEVLLYTPIIAEEALCHVNPLLNGELDFELFEGERPDPQAALYDADGHLKNVSDDEPTRYAGRQFHMQIPLNVGGLECLLVTSTTPFFEAEMKLDSPAIIAIGGTALSLFLAAMVWSLGVSRARAIGLAESITQELRESELATRLAAAKSDRLAEIARRTSNAVVITDVEGKIEWVNDGFTRITGYELEEVLGKKPGTFLQGEKSDPAVAALLGDSVRKGEPVKAAIVNYSKAGREYVLEIEIEPLRDAQGVINGFMAIESDITERIRQEQALKESEWFACSTVDALAAHLTILDESGKIIAVNNAWRKFAQENELHKSYACEGTNYLAVCDAAQGRHSSEAGTVAAGIRAVIRGEQAEFALEYPCHSPRERRWFIVRVTRFAGDGPVRVVVVHENITQQKLSELELEKASKRANDASLAKSAFLANMSHEIRTPLTAILGYSDLLRDAAIAENQPPSKLHTINTIRNAGQHLLTVINDILDLSKIEAGKMQTESIETDLPRILLEVDSLMRSRVNDNGVDLRTVLDTAVPDRIISDPTRIRQILLNLVGNAVKFTTQGEITIRARLARSGGQRKLQLRIIDTGPGMSAEQTALLFQAFNQADSTVTRTHGGTGLGLTISRRLARLMGGDVRLEYSEPGRGSCFLAEFPVINAPHSTLVNDLVAYDLQTPRTPSQSTTRLAGRILLAEDGLDNQRLISLILRKAGAEVEIAENGRLALEKIHAAEIAGNPYDLLLTDIQMPEMDGLTLTKMLRAVANEIPIVALTAHAMAEDRQNCLNAGCNDYATKPIDKATLLLTCEKWLAMAFANSG